MAPGLRERRKGGTGILACILDDQEPDQEPDAMDTGTCIACLPLLVFALWIRKDSHPLIRNFACLKARLGMRPKDHVSE